MIKKKPIKTRKIARGRIFRKLDSEQIEKRKEFERAYSGTTTGVVIDTADPQGMGRLRIFCPAIGDTQDVELEAIPWAMYGTPFGGSVGYGTRGAEDSQVDGSVAYGFWGIPKIGATCLVTCIDGNSEYRVWTGCIYPQFLVHTMPHGRYLEGKEGPFDSREQPVQPLDENFEEAYEGMVRVETEEWFTRGADRQVSAVNNTLTSGVDEEGNDLAMNDKVDEDGRGYQKSRQHPNIPGSDNGKNTDSLVYSWTTPGNHTISMDDAANNTRIRIRTTGGQQIILDDTNERIYLSSAKGRNWIELDQQGNIDMFTDGNTSIHSRKNINFTADENINMYAGGKINLVCEDEYRLHAVKDIHIHTDQNYRQYSEIDTKIEAKENHHLLCLNRYEKMKETSHTIATDGMTEEVTDGDLSHKASGKVYLEAVDKDMHIRTGANFFLEATEDLHIKTDQTLYLTSVIATNTLVTEGFLIETAALILHNPAAEALEATEADEALTPVEAEIAEQLWAWGPSRVPEKEGWNRSATLPGAGSDDQVENNDPRAEPPNILKGTKDNGRVEDSQKEFPNTSGSSNKSDRDRKFERGKNWRR
jgi:hypothetical protein